MSYSKKFIFVSDQVITFCSKFQEIQLENLNEEILEIKLIELERRWKILIEIFDIIMTTEDEELDEEFCSSVSSKFEVATESYQQCKANIMNLRKIEQNSNNISNNESFSRQRTSSPNNSPSTPIIPLNIPPCDIPIFHGGYSQWPCFRDLFSAVYGKHPNLSPAQKLYHLYNKTRAEANKIVGRFELWHGQPLKIGMKILEY